MDVLKTKADTFDVANYAEVYAHVEQTWQDPQRANLYHNVLSRILKPNVQFGTGVEDRIDQELKNGAQCAIAFTHGSAVDPVQIAAMASQNKVFEPIIAKTMIGAKVSLFTTPIIGKIVPDLGAIPIWRKKDVLNDSQNSEEQERLEALRKLAGLAFVQTEITGMKQGLHMAKHVEGTRNKDDPKKILTIRDGFGKVVCGAGADTDILMITAAFWYGEGSSKTTRKPTIYLDIPQNQRRIEPEGVTRTIAPALQGCLSRAVTLHGNNP
jgi:1-acyl-sn-glycerol-3-phosphate acyltransferase